MTHAEAAERLVVERYLLNELTDEERDDFEAHLFDCLTCAEDLKDAATFLDTSRELLRAEKSAAIAGEGASATGNTRARVSRWRWLAWLDLPAMRPMASLAVPASVLLLGVALYQNVVTIPALRESSTPQALSAFSFVSSGTRAGGPPLVVQAPPNQPFLLFVDIPPTGHFVSYHCTIVSDTGTPEVSVEVSAAQARDTIQMFIPAARLQPGSHTLVITGAGPAAGDSQPEIARYPFVLQGSH
jgi:hypothetical protein